MWHPITDRIEELWRSKGYKHETDFWSSLEIPRNTVQNLKKKKKKGFPAPSTEALRAIAEAVPDVNLHWLILGEGTMLRANNINPMSQNVDYQELLLLALDRASRLAKEAAELRSQLVDLKSITESPPTRKRGRARHDMPSATENPK